jgi:hypothetical protein
MDIKSIKQVVNSGLPKDYQEDAILSILASDKKVVTYLLEMLKIERSDNREYILDSNMELSRALIVLNDVHLKAGKKIIADPKWVVGEINKHYLKWKDFNKSLFSK